MNNTNNVNGNIQMNNGFCFRCGQKMTNPKYCLHCGAQTELFIQEHKDVATKDKKEQEAQLKKSFKTLQKAYFIMLAVSIVILAFGAKYLYTFMALGAVALLSSSKGSGMVSFFALGVPLIYYLIFWIVAFKTFLISIINIKYEKSTSTIGTSILSLVSIVRVGATMLLMCIVISYLLTAKDIATTQFIFFNVK